MLQAPLARPFFTSSSHRVKKRCKACHVIVLNEGHLRRRLHSYLRYYHGPRTHLALEKDAPEPRAVEPPAQGRVVALPQVGGLHHRYIRRAA